MEALKSTIEQLKKNFLASESELYIFSDGYASSADRPASSTDRLRRDHDKECVKKVRQFIHSIEGFKKITIRESAGNKGLANSIIHGVTEIFNSHDQVIVLEDDLITTPNFLDFMNAALTRYSSDKKVFSISGYSFDMGRNVDKEAYFLNRGWSWGWATWKDRWEYIDWKMKDYQEFIRDAARKREFARGGSDLVRMLKRQMNGELDSWAIRWFFHQYKTGTLSLYPVESKVINIGFDEFATHTKGVSDKYRPSLDTNHSRLFNFPSVIAIDPYYQKKFQQKMGLASRIVSRLRSIISSF